MEKIFSLKQKIYVFCLIFFVAFFNFTALSYVGWFGESGKMTYVTNEGYKVANAWRESDGMMFYLDSDGYVVYNKVFEYNGSIYYVGRNGARVKDQFVNVTEDMILGDYVTPGCFYFTEDGTAFVKYGNNFIKTIDNKKYAFDDMGHMFTDCWISKDGNYIEPSPDVLLEGVYLAKENGVLYQNEWYDFTFDASSSYELEKSNLIADDYNDLYKMWMYFDNKCCKVHGNVDSSKRLVLNGKEYSFDENGIILLGFQKNKTDLDISQGSNPVIHDRLKVYDKEEGYLLKNKWLYEETPLVYTEGFENDDKSYWRYIDNEGLLVKNKIKTVNGHKYAFDGLGRLRKGFVLMDGISFYGAEYKAEDLNKDDFVYPITEGGRLYGSDLLDIHYFSESEDENEGRMVTKGINIDLDDGNYEFLFRSNGIAYGNKNELKLYKDSYYKNGIKFIPWEDTKYGIVKVSDDEYRVINKNGKLIKAKKRVIVDDYENFIVILNDRLAAYIKRPVRKVKLVWKTINGETGYFYYDLDLEKKKYTGMAVASGTTCPTTAQIDDIPKDIRVNFR